MQVWLVRYLCVIGPILPTVTADFCIMIHMDLVTRLNARRVVLKPMYALTGPTGSLRVLETLVLMAGLSSQIPVQSPATQDLYFQEKIVLLSLCVPRVLLARTTQDREAQARALHALQEPI
jgi:hypothetical protein